VALRDDEVPCDRRDFALSPTHVNRTESTRSGKVRIAELSCIE